MIKLKIMMVCGMMLLPSLSQAQGCCKKEKMCQKKQQIVCAQKACTQSTCEKTACPKAAECPKAATCPKKSECPKAADCSKKSCCAKNNSVVQTIMSRRSVRKYLDQPVEHEKLALIAKCGISAPNAMNQQNWAIRVVENQDFITATTAIFKKENPEQVKRDVNFKNMYRNAPNIIIVATPRNDQYGMVNAGLLGENMMLAAQSMGLGTCCLGGSARFLQTNEACKPYLAQLNLPDGYEICYILAVGYPDEAPEAKPRDESKIEFIK